MEFRRVLFRSDHLAIAPQAQDGISDALREGHGERAEVCVGSCRGRSTAAALTANILSIDVDYFFDAGGPDDVSAHALSAITDEDRLAISRRCYRKVTKTRTFRADILPRLREQRSEEHTSELQSLMRISYAVFCLKKKK